MDVLGNKQKAYIFDFDGVLSDNSKREYLLHQENKSEEECRIDFYSASEKDDPFHETVELLKTLSIFGYKILIVTARSKAHDVLLNNWLKKNSIFQYVHCIYSCMKEDINKQSDWKKKYDIYNDYIKNKYDICGVFEDNEDCIEMYTKAFGLTCYCVKRGVSDGRVE